VDKKSAGGEKSDDAVLISLVSCLRNESLLYTRLFWGVFVIQLALTGILLISLGLLFRFFGFFSMFLIGLVGAVCVLLLYRAGSIYDLHIVMFNESCGRLESDLPEEIKAYTVMQTYSGRIEPKIKPFNSKKIFLYSTLFLFLLWLTTSIWSGYEIFRSQYPTRSERYQEVLPFPKK
jgi:hypothetical protein